jgi:hypothetical protein
MVSTGSTTVPASVRRSARTLTRRWVRRRRWRLTRRGVVVFSLLGASFVVAAVWPFSRRPAVEVTGLDDGRTYGAAELPTSVTVTFDRPVTSVFISMNGEGLPVEVSGLAASATLGALAEGEHRIIAEVDRGSLSATVSVERVFFVDTTPPGLEVVEPLSPVPPNEPMSLRFAVDDPTAVVAVDGLAIEVGSNGYFEVDFPAPPAIPVVIVATDPFGNEASTNFNVMLALPGNEGGPHIRGVHASGYTWDSAALKDPIMAMIADGRINTVEIDLKDENGEVWYDTSVALAHEIGAVNELWSLAEVIDELHERGVRVIGRLVVFRDPKLANHAVAAGRTDLIVQNPDGSPYGQYGGFTNPFNAEVWEYNIALAEEAARLGIDDVLYDYVRRPDENIARMRFPGQGSTTPEDTIVGFLEASLLRVHAAGARLGASVFGIAATRPDEIAQDIPRMAATVDFIAPMVYPSHWGPGEYGVANPNASPYDITYRSLVDFQSQVNGTGASLVAWLQDFSLGVEYGPAEVQAQIDAAKDAGVLDFLLWDAAATYTAAALSPTG